MYLRDFGGGCFAMSQNGHFPGFLSVFRIPIAQGLVVGDTYNKIRSYDSILEYKLLKQSLLSA